MSMYVHKKRWKTVFTWKNVPYWRSNEDLYKDIIPRQMIIGCKNEQ